MNDHTCASFRQDALAYARSPTLLVANINPENYHPMITLADPTVTCSRITKFLVGWPLKLLYSPWLILLVACMFTDEFLRMIRLTTNNFSILENWT